jgi:L-xylulokinase
LAQSNLFVQILANVADRPVSVNVEYEAAAVGAAMCAAAGTGLYPDLRAAAKEMTRARTVEPQAEWVSRYKAIYRRWVKTLPQMAALR